MPDVWCSSPFDLKLRNGFSFSSGHQLEGSEQQQETQKDKTYGTNKSVHSYPRLFGINDSLSPSSSEDSWEDHLETHDPFYEWYGNDISDALRRVGRNVDVRDFSAPIIVPSAQEATDPMQYRNLLTQLPLVTRTGNARRPYLSLCARSFLPLMGAWDGFSEFDGQLIHVDFTEPELEIMCQGLSAFFLPRSGSDTPHDHLRVPDQIGWLSELIRNLVRNYGKGKFGEFLENAVIPNIHLNGRNGNDILLFLEDCFNMVTPTGEFIKISLEESHKLATCKVSGRTSKQTSRLHLELGMGSGPRKHPAQTIGNLRSGALRLLRPLKRFSGGSSDVINVAWSPDGSKFALGTTTLNDAYNRPGNLVLGCMENMVVKVLDGHKIDRPERQREATLDDQIRCTVTGLDFSGNGSLMYSSSYDHTIKLWETKNGNLLETFDLKSIVMTMSVAQPHGTIAASAKSGNVTTLRFGGDGSRASHQFPATKKGLYASTLLWAGELNPNWLLAGYDTDHRASVSGDCLILDALTGQKVHTIRPSTGGHYDMFLHHQTGFLATGVSAPLSKSNNTHSYVRIYSLANQASYAKKVLEFDSSQKDINVVTISPCQLYVTSSGTDCSTYVWDVRYPGALLARLQHGVTLMPSGPDSDLEAEDSGVTFARWGPYDGHLYTGGSDGVLKVWDVTKGDPFVQDIVTLDAQIMSAAFSPASDMLLVGVASGKATLLSTSVDDESQLDEFEVDLSDVSQPPEEIPEGAVEELLTDEGEFDDGMIG